MPDPQPYSLQAFATHEDGAVVVRYPEPPEEEADLPPPFAGYPGITAWGEEEEAETPPAEDAPTESADTPPPDAAPSTYTEEDMQTRAQAARQEGYQDGLEAGRTAERAAIEAEDLALKQQAVEALEEQKQALAQMDTEYRAALTAERALLPDLILAAAAKLAGAVPPDTAAAAVRRMVETCLTQLHHPPRLTIHTPEPLQPAIDAYARMLKDSLHPDTALQVVADPELSGSACRIRWEHGEMRRDPDALRTTLEDTLSHLPALLGAAAEEEAPSTEGKELLTRPDDNETTQPTETEKR